MYPLTLHSGPASACSHSCWAERGPWLWAGCWTRWNRQMLGVKVKAGGRPLTSSRQEELVWASAACSVDLRAGGFYDGLEFSSQRLNPMDRGAWGAPVHGAQESGHN